MNATDKYEDYVNSYRKYIIETAKQLRSDTKANVTDESISADADDIIDFESNLASVS